MFPVFFLLKMILFSKKFASLTINRYICSIIKNLNHEKTSIFSPFADAYLHHG